MNKEFSLIFILWASCDYSIKI